LTAIDTARCYLAYVIREKSDGNASDDRDGSKAQHYTCNNQDDARFASRRASENKCVDNDFNKDSEHYEIYQKNKRRGNAGADLASPDAFHGMTDFEGSIDL
jgi:hypothetical protein